MSITSPPTWSFPPPGCPLRPISVHEYHQMIQAGILTEDDRVELLEGWIVPKMPHNPPHDGTIQSAGEVISSHLPPGWRVRTQSVVTTSDSEPEPDLAIVRGDRRTYLSRHPGPADVGTVVEVSDTTLARDRDLKARIYARAGIGVYWIINLVDMQIEVYTDPTGPDPSPCYRQRQDFLISQSVPLVLDGQTVAQVRVRDLLP